MPGPRVITFTTDFGTSDTYAGQLHGAALTVCPEARLVDLTHEVPPHDVAAGAFLLETGYRAFPRGTIHVVVVDPGVGTPRRAVGVRTDGGYFLAPDNGVLSRVLDAERVESAHVLEAAHYRRQGVSATFEGRDVFAPAAGWLARGVELSNFGPRAGELVRLPAAPTIVPGAPARIRVVYVDRFGNAILDAKRSVLEPLLGGRRLVARTSDGREITRLRRTYADGDADGPFLLFGSAGYLEIALREGPAAERLGLRPGSEIDLTVV